MQTGFIIGSTAVCATDLDVLHEAVALATAGQRLATGSDGGKGYLHQFIHTWKMQEKDIAVTYQTFQSLISPGSVSSTQVSLSYNNTTSSRVLSALLSLLFHKTSWHSLAQDHSQSDPFTLGLGTPPPYACSHGGFAVGTSNQP